MVYMGTAIEEGQSKFIVTDIGINTEIGKINRLVGEIKEEKLLIRKNSPILKTYRNNNRNNLRYYFYSGNNNWRSLLKCLLQQWQLQ